MILNPWLIETTFVAIHMLTYHPAHIIAMENSNSWGKGRNSSQLQKTLSAEVVPGVAVASLSQHKAAPVSRFQGIKKHKIGSLLPLIQDTKYLFIF